MAAYVHILTSGCNGPLFIGIACDIVKRVYERKNKLVKGFTSRYNIDQFLLWFEQSDSIESAITRERQHKKWKRIGKIELIEKSNPYWNGLYDSIV